MKKIVFNKGMRAIIIFLIFILFIMPTSIGFNIDMTNDNLMKKENFNKFYFYYYEKYSTPTVSNYKGQFLKKSYDNSLLLSNEIDTSVLTTINGPMDSPWPVKCHDSQHSGRSPYSTANNPGFEVWRFYTDGWIEEAPSIGSDGTLYFPGAYNDIYGYLFAITSNGTFKWVYNIGDITIGNCPSIDENGTIYIGSWDWGLHAVNPDGTRKWRFGAGANIASSPAIAEDGTIYFGLLGPGDIGRVYALYSDGTEKWHYDTGYWITSDPAIGDDGIIYIGSGDTYLYAINPDGTLKWRFKTGHYVKGPPSIASDGTIYCGSWDGYLYAVYPNNGTLKWRHAVGPGTETNPSIASDGTIYVGSDKLYAINSDGTRKWSFDLTSTERIHKSCPAISAEGTIYFGTKVGDAQGGRIYAVNPDGTKKWHEWIASEFVQSSPSIGEDGTVYIGSAWMDGGISYGYIHAFNRGVVKAEAHGPYYGLINIPLQFTGSATCGYPPYSWHWDFKDGNTSNEQNPLYTYSTPGNYNVILTVTDNSGNTSDDTAWALIQETNTPPNAPTITGPTSGEAGEFYEYNFETIDVDGNNIWYYVEWGDGYNTGWLGPYNSGVGFTKGHRWTNQGDYTIECKAKDWYNEEGPWGTLDVTMPLNQQNNLNMYSLSSILFQFLQRLNHNVGFIN